MLYTPENARGATAHDVDTGEKLAYVLEVNTKSGWVKVAHNPIRITPDGKSIMSERIRFRSIYPIWAGQGMPVMFHCYGRQDAAAT